jgi:hypothetical protein
MAVEGLTVVIACNGQDMLSMRRESMCREGQSRVEEEDELRDAGVALALKLLRPMLSD